ncbi:MAG: MotA/TolQ/ExbB proton channel family protein, partial [candidate division Zixibacteria bacterium]|nr:MotA/TolQ/ExbB proton channel family protein [candidate division Zixibacteria bacterium]
MDSSIIVTSIFLILMFVAFRITPERKRGDKLPTILTSIGILGTFMGIFIGLWNFNVNAVQESIPQLLEGLKIAFMTSIVGIFSALIIKYIYILRVEKEETGKVTN